MNPDRRKAPIKRRLRELGNYALTDFERAPCKAFPDGKTESIPGSYVWNGQAVSTSTWWLESAIGRTDPTSLGRTDAEGNTSKRKQDVFTVDCRIEIVRFDITEDDLAEEEAERAFNAIARTIETASHLVHPDVPSAMDPARFDVTSCEITDTHLYCGFPDPTSLASISGGVTFTVEIKYPLKPTPLQTGS